MARVTYGPYVTDLKGSIGGVTFQNNKAGAISRLKQNYGASRSNTQVIRQNQFRRCTALWNSLSATDKAAWDSFAVTNLLYDRYGGSKTVSGHQYFMSCNRMLTSFSAYTVSTPPTFSAPPSVPVFTATVSSSVFTIDFGSPFSFTGHSLIVFASPPLKSASEANRRYLCSVYVRTTTPTTTFSLASPYATIFLPDGWANFFTGSKCFISVNILVMSQSAGLISPFQSLLVPINT